MRARSKTMTPEKEFRQILEKTKILKNPKHRLSTFGETKITYYFLSEVSGFKDRSRLREGTVIAEKPQIITPDLFRNRFEGFGKEAKAFGDWLKEKYGESFQGLEYKFRNESRSVQIEYSSIKTLAERMLKKLVEEESGQSAVIQGPDLSWHISLMKFIVDECAASFTTNLRDLDEHGFFEDPEKTLKQKRKEIEELFVKAKRDRMFVPLLSKKLRSYGMFKDYEDQFFRLIQ